MDNKERPPSKPEGMDKLHFLRNSLLAQLAEVNMAIDRETFNRSSTTKTVTQQTQELLRRLQVPRGDDLFEGVRRCSKETPCAWCDPDRTPPRDWSRKIVSKPDF